LEARDQREIEEVPAGELRPDLLNEPRLRKLERLNIALVRRTLSLPVLNRVMAWCQRVPGATWVDLCTRKIRHEYGLERLPPNESLRSFIVVSNHRSYFDLFVVSMVLFKRAKVTHRIVFPVRSSFFYDHPLGFLVNAVMSWCSMYPPIFRDRKRAVLNHASMEELVWLLAKAGFSAGIHPEGTRNKGDDPYSFLPAQHGVGRAIYHARTTVLPVFINGLGNRLGRQILGSFSGQGEPVNVVFGAPVDFGSLYDAAPSARTYHAVAERALDAIRALGEEERKIRTGDRA
jgi:1-acyl-sn-glycerol-3-phosphate acyltransferase